MRTHTQRVESVREDGRKSSTITVQRVCNGCGHSIGDVTEEEMDRAVAGLPLLDVRDECPWCSSFVEGA